MTANQKRHLKSEFVRVIYLSLGGMWYIHLVPPRGRMHTLLDLPPRQSFVSDVRRVSLQTRMFAGHDVGDVMSNLFKSDARLRGRWCEFLVTVEGHCRYDNCRRRKWSPRKCGKFMCCFTGTVKHVEGNMSSGNMYWILLSLLSVIVSALHSNSPVTVKAATNFSDSE